MFRNGTWGVLPRLAVASLLLAADGAAAGQVNGSLAVAVTVVSPCRAELTEARIEQSCIADVVANVLVETSAAPLAASPAGVPTPVISGDREGGPTYLTLVY